MGKKIYIVEDVSVIRLMLEEIVLNNGYKLAGSSASAEEAWEEITKIELDLVLLDIQLAGEKNGIWLGNKINTELHIPFIYITANQEQSLSTSIVETNPIGFIVKPINTIQLLTTIKIALNIHPSNYKKQILIKDKNRTVNITIDDIYYIKSDGNYIDIYLETSHFLVRSTLEEFASKLPQNIFLRIHQRIYFNSTKKYELKEDSILILGTPLPVSARYKKELKERLR